MNKYAILLGGDLEPTERLRQQISGAKIIAADSGIKHAAVLNVSPMLWVGDFDSAGSELALDYAAVPKLVFSADKDATDGEIAVNEALKLGATALILVGAFGGQADHALAHLTLLINLARRGINCFATSGTEEAFPLLHNVLIPDLPISTRLSIVPLSDVTGLTISGVKWPLNKRNVKLGETLTLSNVTTGLIEISTTSGYGLILTYPESSL